MPHLTNKQANKAFDILMPFGAQEGGREGFVAYMTTHDRHCQGYAFTTHDGLTMKVYNLSLGVVAAYDPADDSPTRRRRLNELNNQLKPFKQVG